MGQKPLVLLILLLSLTDGLRVPLTGLTQNILTQLDNVYSGLFSKKVTYVEKEAKIPKWYSSAEECKRNCSASGGYKTCYYNFVLEYYAINGGLNEEGTPISKSQCILADGVEKTVVVANRLLPGPAIDVCLGDTVVVDVVNQIEGAEVTIHWHGVLQTGTPYYDGVPYVTQCPIHRGTTFRYTWKAGNEGTHFWHSHTGFQKLDGLMGSIKITNPNDVHSHWYDYDRDVMVLQDWMHEPAMSRFPGKLYNGIGQKPDNILINGKGTSGRSTITTPLEVFEVIPGKRYRIRIIAALATTCVFQLAVENHKLLSIATDGEPYQPVVVDTLRVLSAERFDVIINANREVDSYWIQVIPIGHCASLKLSQLAILKYVGSGGEPTTPPPTYDNRLLEFNGKLLNSLDGNCRLGSENTVCVSDLMSADPPDARIANPQPDVKIFLPFRFITRNNSELFEPGKYNSFMVAGGGHHLTAVIDSISFESPTNPLILQLMEGKPISHCNNENLPKNCDFNCVCTHMIPIKLGSMVEVVIVDEVGIPGLSHPFHLHGHCFHVIGEGRWGNPEEKMDLRKAVILDMNQKMTRRLDDAPKKDTIAVPTNGYVVLRFLADNPGFWFFHCHFMYHMAIGMNMVFQVGDRLQMPPVPKGFPQCKSFLPDNGRNLLLI